MEHIFSTKKQEIIDFVQNKLKRVFFVKNIYSIENQEHYTNRYYYDRLKKATPEQEKLIKEIYLEIIEDALQFLKEAVEKDDVFKLEKENNAYILKANYSYLTIELIELSKHHDLNSVPIDKWIAALPQTKINTSNEDLWNTYHDLLPNFKKDVDLYVRTNLIIMMFLQTLEVKLRSRMMDSPQLLSIV